MWVNRKTGPPAIDIENVDDAEEAKDAFSLLVIGYFEKFEGEAYEAFKKAAQTVDDEVSFAQVSSPDVAAVFDLKDYGIVLFKDTGDEFTHFKGEMSTDAIKTFVLTEALPLVNEFSDETAKHIFSAPVSYQVRNEYRIEATKLQYVSSILIVVLLKINGGHITR